MRWKSQQEFIATVGRFSAGEFERIRQMTPRARNAFSYIQMHSIEEFAGQLLVLLSNEGPSAWQEPACSVMESGTLVLQTCRDLAVAPEGKAFVTTRDAILQIGLPTDRTSTRKWYSDLAQTARTLRVAYDRYAYAGEGTVVEHVQGLPEELKWYFLESRDCISVDMEELGALSALRGLEAVLREIARGKKLTLDLPPKASPPAKPSIRSEPLHRADLRDVIEASGRVQWADTGAPMIEKTTKQLLETLRTFRNDAAHPRKRAYPGGVELAILAAKQATLLWDEGSVPRRRLKMKNVTKNW